MSGKQCRPRLDSTFCGVWSGSTKFAGLSVSIFMINTDNNNTAKGDFRLGV